MCFSFTEYFRDMLNKARMGFHDMFKKTYGMMYEQNSYLFQDLFRDLEKYYDSGNTNIIEVLENFFSVLCQKMFTVMNSQFTFESKWVNYMSTFHGLSYTKLLLFYFLFRVVYAIGRIQSRKVYFFLRQILIIFLLRYWWISL